MHADAVKAVFYLREALIHPFVVTDSVATPVQRGGRKNRGWQPPSYEEERATAFNDFDRADRKIAEMVYMAESFGSPGVRAALHEFGHVSRWYVQKYWQTPVDERLACTDLDNVMEYLISALCDETRRDSDAAYGSKRSRAKLEDGHPTWLGALKDMGAYQAAELESATATAKPAQTTPGRSATAP